MGNPLKFDCNWQARAQGHHRGWLDSAVLYLAAQRLSGRPTRVTYHTLIYTTAPQIVNVSVCSGTLLSRDSHSSLRHHPVWRSAH